MKLREIINLSKKKSFRPVTNRVNILEGDKFLWMGNPVQVFDIVDFPKLEITLPDGNKIIVPCEEVLFRINIE